MFAFVSFASLEMQNKEIRKNTEKNPMAIVVAVRLPNLNGH